MRGLAGSVRGFALPAVIVALCGAGFGWRASAAETPGLTRAAELLKNQQWPLVIEVLQKEVPNLSAEQAVKHCLMIGEASYMLKRYPDAKIWLEKALPYAQGQDKAVAMYRMAGVFFRLGEPQNCIKAVDEFVNAYPNDLRKGKLLVFKMAILAQQGRQAEAQVLSLHQQINRAARNYDHTVAVEADGVLSDFYVRTGQLDRALDVFQNAIHDCQRVIQAAGKGEDVERSVLKYHDAAAIHAGILCLDRKQFQQAIRWFENVRYDPDQRTKARLYMARTQYERGLHDDVITTLTEGDYVKTVQDLMVRSDMYLLLGMAEKERRSGNVHVAADYLSKVRQDSRGYCQAQCALGDLYRAKGLREEAIQPYQSALASSDYAPAAYFGLGCVYMDLAEEVKGDQQRAIYKKAADAFTQLKTRYPLSPQAKACQEKVEQLRVKGMVDVSAVASDDELRDKWERVAKDKPGTVDAAQALLSLLRLQFKRVEDEKTRKVLKLPDYKAAAQACDRLLDDNVYGRVWADEQWAKLKPEVIHTRAVCELVSVSPAPGRGPQPTYLEKATVEKSIQLFRLAKAAVDAKDRERVKAVELGLLEALFKSEKKEDKAAAQARFQELESEYGSDPRFQRLTLELAQWFEDQDRHLDAARAYESMADRARELPEEELLKAYYRAGALYSKVAQDMQENAKGEKGCGLYLYPREALNVEENILKSHRPFYDRVEPRWPDRQITAREALNLLSQTSGIPFVWSPSDAKLNQHLDTKKVQLPVEKQPVGVFLEQILDFKVFRLAMDLGLSGGQPTVAPKKSDDPDYERSIVIEIFDVARGEARFAAVNRPYGNFAELHRGRPPMLLSVLRTIEEKTGMKVAWSESVNKDDKLAVEVRPSLFAQGQNYTCGQVLSAILETMDLRWKVVPRDVSADFYDRAKECFNKLRRIDPRSKWGERALYILALNYHEQKDYRKMKVVLREYLRVFDSPSYEFYHEACFWIGWLAEHEKTYRDAYTYYNKAIEERLVVCKPAEGQALPSREDFRKRFSNETQFALAVPVSGQFKEYALSQFVDFLQINTQVLMRVEAGVETTGLRVNRDPFKAVPALDVLYDALRGLDLSVKVENANLAAAERAYFRLAVTYKKDDMMDLALECCNTLLTRFPETKRRKDVYALMLEIHKALKDYSKILDTLQNLRALCGNDVEGYKFDLELAGIYYNLCHYEKALELYKLVRPVAKGVDEQALIKESMARCHLRQGRLPEARALYEELEKEEAAPLRRFAHKLTVFYLRFLQNEVNASQFPDEAWQMISAYERLPDAQRERMKTSDLIAVTWGYYVLGMMELKQGKFEEGIQKLTCASSSQDPILAGEAGYQAALAHWEARATRPASLQKAREMCEYVLFTSKGEAAESAIRCTYLLGQCLKAMGQPDKAYARFAQLLQKYPASPYAEKVRKEEGLGQPAPSGGTKPEAKTDAPAAKSDGKAEAPAPKTEEKK